MSYMEGKEVTITIRVEESLRDDFKRLAEKNERTFSGEVRRALRLHVLSQMAVSDAPEAA